HRVGAPDPRPVPPEGGRDVPLQLRLGGPAQPVRRLAQVARCDQGHLAGHRAPPVDVVGRAVAVARATAPPRPRDARKNRANATAPTAEITSSVERIPMAI